MLRIPLATRTLMPSGSGPVVASRSRQIACWMSLASCQRSAATTRFWSMHIFCNNPSMPVGLLFSSFSASVVRLSSSPWSWLSICCPTESIMSARFLWFQSAKFPLSCVSIWRYCSVVRLAFLPNPPNSLTPYLTQFVASSWALYPSSISCSKAVCLAVTVSTLSSVVSVLALHSFTPSFCSAA